MKFRNGFYEEPETGFVTLVVDGICYDICGDGTCMLPGNIPGILSNMNDDLFEDIEYYNFLKNDCEYSTEITISDVMIPWISEQGIEEITLKISDIDIAHAISLEDSWDATRKYFEY